MSFASGLQVTARRLLLTYGQVVNFSRTVESDYNPATSEAVNTTITTFSGYGHPEPYLNSEVNGTTVLSTDINLLTYVTTLPVVGDIAILDTIEYRIMNVTKTRAQGTDIIYNLQLRL